MRVAACLPLILALSIAACGDDTPTSPSTSSSTPARATERFDAIIGVNGSAFFAFSVGANGPTSINLASLSALDRPGALSVTMEIGWGKVVKDEGGTVVGCSLQKVIQTAPGLAAQLTDTLSPASDYCANIADVGGLREAANFSIRVTHP